jgi:tRNA (uracil-5-)-methyltransferase TRM9
MNTATIKILNQLNQDFYNKVTADFDDSRQYFWAGWHMLLPYLKNFSTLKLLDVGCGNGRFLKFTQEFLPKIDLDYLGIDNSEELLFLAQKNNPEHSVNFVKIDLVNELLKSNNDIKEKSILTPKNFNLIVAFGFFHHIPSYKLRLKTLKYLLSKLDHEGLLVISLWQFMELERFAKKRIDPSKIFPDLTLEENDFILNWNRGEKWTDNNKALRYCHYTSKNEQEQLINDSNARLVDSFRADGKEGNVNQYLIFKNN